jgi:hypothetical protein
VLTPKEVVLNGETLLGSYNVEIARWVNSRWTPTVPPLFAIVTDQRLVLQPYGRKRREPAIIPGRYIAKVVNMDEQRRNMIMMTIKTGHQITLFISGPQCAELAQHLRAIARVKKYDPDIDPAILQKMIAFFDSL